MLRPYASEVGNQAHPTRRTSRSWRNEAVALVFPELQAGDRVTRTVAGAGAQRRRHPRPCRESPPGACAGPAARRTRGTRTVANRASAQALAPATVQRVPARRLRRARRAPHAGDSNGREPCQRPGAGTRDRAESPRPAPAPGPPRAARGGLERSRTVPAPRRWHPRPCRESPPGACAGPAARRTRGTRTVANRASAQALAPATVQRVPARRLRRARRAPQAGGGSSREAPSARARRVGWARSARRGTRTPTGCPTRSLV